MDAKTADVVPFRSRRVGKLEFGDADAGIELIEQHEFNRLGINHAGGGRGQDKPGLGGGGNAKARRSAAAQAVGAQRCVQKQHRDRRGHTGPQDVARHDLLDAPDEGEIAGCRFGHASDADDARPGGQIVHFAVQRELQRAEAGVVHPRRGRAGGAPVELGVVHGRLRRIVAIRREFARRVCPEMPEAAADPEGGDFGRVVLLHDAFEVEGHAVQMFHGVLDDDDFVGVERS